MSFLTRAINSNDLSKSIVGALVLLLLVVMIELFAFNHHYFFSKVDNDSYEHQKVALPFNDQYKANLIVVSKDSNEVNLSNLNLNIANIAIKINNSYSQAIKVYVFAKKQGQNFVAIGNTKMNPANPKQDRAVIHFNESGDEHKYEALKIVFDRYSPFMVGVIDIELNVAESLNFSFVRLLLGFTILFAVYLIWQYRLYEIVLDENKRSHRYANLAVALFGVAISSFFFWGTYPKNTNPWYFDFIGEGVYAFNNNDRDLLYKLPQTVEETSNAGAYEQLLAAWLKGQNNINLYVDPKLAQLKNPYDPSERMASGVKMTLDRPYYKGNYYVYFGVAPLIMVYAPIYALTGMVPSPSLSSYILSVIAVLAILWAYRSLVRAFVPQVNLLLYLAVQLSALSATNIWLIHVGLSFYFLPYLTAMIWLSVYVASIYSLFKPANENYKGINNSKAKIRAMLLIAGISVPMLVCSRPLVLFLSISLSIPALVLLVKENYTDRINKIGQGLNIRFAELVKDVSFAFILVVIGALLVAYYNYARFESISEFGQSYQLTGDDVTAKSLVWGWAHLRNAIYYFFFEQLNYVKEFPFVFANETTYVDHGNQVINLEHFGLFSLPIYWSLFLAFRKGSSLLVNSQGGLSNKEHYQLMLNRMYVLKLTCIFTMVVMVIVAYGAYYNAAVFSRYLSDITTAGSFLAVLLILLNFGNTKLSVTNVSQENVVNKQEKWPSQVMLGFAWFVVLKSFVLGVLLPFCFTPSIIIVLGAVFNELNPDLMVECYRIFTPWGY